MNPADRAAKLFIERHGRDPEAVFSAPGRVNLIGEHTDYNDGFVLPFALPHRVAVAISRREDRMLAARTLGDDGQLHAADATPVDALAPGGVTGWAAFPAGVAWALREAGYPVEGADLVIAGTVPTGAGLSSSHALQCAIALALLDRAGFPQGSPDAPSLPRIARLVQVSENDFVGAPTGLLDQTASLCCVADNAFFHDVRSGDSEQVPFDPRSAGLELLAIDTRAKHSHSESGYGDRREGCERAAEVLSVKALRDVSIDELPAALEELPAELRPLVRHVVTENDRVLRTVELLRADRYTDVGPLLDASHASLRDDYRVSSVELDLAVEAARSAGALGARMIGGGFGGSAIALINSTEKDAIEQATRRAFAAHNLAEPRIFTAIPSAGAGRDR